MDGTVLFNKELVDVTVHPHINTHNFLRKDKKHGLDVTFSNSYEYDRGENEKKCLNIMGINSPHY